MYRNCLPLVTLFIAGGFLVSAQVPKPPLTEKDLELGKQYVTTIDELHKQLGPLRAPSDKPFKIIGNLYFVGDTEGGGLLLTSPQGHILFGTGWVENAESIQKNIESMGFKMTDIKVILINHNHPDEAGGAAYMKEKTGAQIMAGFPEVPFIERRNPNPPPGAAPGRGGRGGGIQPPPVKVDRALYDGDVVKVGPLSVTAYLGPGHTAASTSWLFTITDGNRKYRTFEYCCWQFPDDISKAPYITEAAVRHTFETWRKLLPVDIYLENHVEAWGSILGQPAGTLAERLEKLKANSKLMIDPKIFRALSAAREAEFEEKLVKPCTNCSHWAKFVDRAGAGN